MTRVLNLKYFILMAIGFLQFFSLAFSATKVAAELIEFNRIDATNSVNCPALTQYAIVKNPLYVTFIVSEDAANNSGFADLLLSDENFKSSDSTPQITLYNEGIENHLNLIGASPTDANGNLQIAVTFGRKVLYLDRAVTEDITPLSGNNGFSELELKLSPASNTQARCILSGQIIQSMPFTN